MKYIATVIIALALAAPTASFAHKHKGWGCHKHDSQWGGRYHCGTG